MKSQHVTDVIVCQVYFFKPDFPIKYCVAEIREDSDGADAEDVLEVERKGGRPHGADGRVMNEGAMLLEWMRCIARARTSDADDTFPPTTPAEKGKKTLFTRTTNPAFSVSDLLN